MLHTRCDAALRDARADFERTVAVLREENSTFRRLLEAADRRIDILLTEVAKASVVTATPVPAPPSIVKRRTPNDPIRGLENLLDEVPLGHEAGSFDNARAASLMAAEDDDGAPAASAA